MKSTTQTVYAFRLVSGMDLKKELLSIAEQHHLKAAYIITCVGSLQKAHLRMAGAEIKKQWDEKMEILSLVGTLSDSGCHLHISLSDHHGNTFGGHLLDGCLVHTTAELIIGNAHDLAFNRKTDPTTGYLELEITMRKLEVRDTLQ